MAVGRVQIPPTEDARYCTDAALQTGKLARNRPGSECPISGFFKAEPGTFPGMCCSAGAAPWQPGCPAVRTYRLMYHHPVISSDLFHPLLTVLYVLTIQEHDAI